MLVAYVIVVVVALNIIDRLQNPSKMKRKKRKFWYTEDEEMINLVCDGTVKPMKVSRLPRKHRTIKLRMSELKSKVCRPFAG